jgi:AraC family transcriptional regulator
MTDVLTPYLRQSEPTLALGILSRAQVAVEADAAGHRIARSCGPADGAPNVQTLQTPQFQLTRMQCDEGIHEMSIPARRERGFVISIQLKELADHQLWLNGRLTHSGYYPERGVSVLDLDDGPRFCFRTGFDSLHFYVKRAALDTLADEQGARRIRTLSWGHGAFDETLSHLASALLPALENPQYAGKLFLDHIGKALVTHLACAYGGMRFEFRVARGGLAPWQERRCKEIVIGRIAEQISLEDLANECRLSSRHFARAFKKSTGESPHRWILRRRVEIAKKMLSGCDHPIPAIAIACGFADQSHLTRVFSAMIGAPPGAWRRQRRF